MNQNYNDEMGLSKALGCKPAKNHSTLEWCVGLLGGVGLVCIALFIGLTMVQLVRLGNANDEATELAARVDEFTQCGELESHSKCVDRAVAKNPKKAFAMLKEVREFLSWRTDPSTFWPGNEYYESGGFPVTSLRVSRKQLVASLESYLTAPPAWEK